MSTWRRRSTPTPAVAGRRPVTTPGGVLAVGAPATFAVWDAAGLDEGGFPAVGDGASSPTCRMTVRAGTVIHPP
ncbi:MAG: hypothetical protein ACRCY9_10285 [Phycicoccus sp.]